LSGCLKTRQASGELTAERIIAEGRQLIMRRGYSGFTYADIAEAFDIRKASIRYHVPAKTDFVIAVLQAWCKAYQIAAAIASASRNGFRAMLCRG
jgi:TetR/AcrR family transcriptional regulator, transcriptional repressor for nem operon